MIVLCIQMTKKQTGIGVGIAVAMVALIGLGFWLGVTRKASAKNLKAGTAQVGSSSAGSNYMNLDPSKAGPAASGSSGSSLSVSSGGAQSLGQLGMGGGQAGAQGSSGGGSSSGSSPFDPATFNQYDKYKDSQEALFGDIEKGDGAELTAGKQAVVVYKGWLTNGQLFDQSRTGSDGKLQPFMFTLGDRSVIPGWEQAIYGMKAGGSRLMIIPPAVGYGAKPQGSIPPNSVLVFQVQLIEVR